MEPSLSIAIVTRNRPESLERTLASLSKQTSQLYEVIISDDSNSESMINTNKELAHKYNCKYISGPQKGLYANRNFVAKNCTGTHFRTMDDDHEFPKNHIQACLEAIKTDENAVWTIGEYHPTEKQMPIPAPIPGQLHPRGFSYVPNDMSEYYGISCGASIYPRTTIDRSILNIEIFKFGILYLEYGARLFNMGYNIRYLDNTYIIHHEHGDNGSIGALNNKTSLNISNSAKVFSMFMLSFYHKRTLKNGFLTLSQLMLDIFKKKYTLGLVLDVFGEFKKEAKNLKSNG